MKWKATTVTALVGAAALMTGTSSPALASPGGNGQQHSASHPGPGAQLADAGSGGRGMSSQGIGIGRFVGLGLSSEQITAVHRALVGARVTMQMQGRAEAVAALLKEGTISASQAQALTSAPGRSWMRGLVASGTITASQAKALRVEMVRAGEPDRTAANLAALKDLVAAKVITEEELASIMARLSGEGTPSLVPGLAPGSPLAQGPQGAGHGQGSIHSGSGGRGDGAVGGIGTDDDGTDDAGDENEADD